MSFHAGIIESIGIPEERIFTLEDGDILELTPLGGKKPARSNRAMYIGRPSVGDVGGIVLRNRKMLSRDGIVVIVIAVGRRIINWRTPRYRYRGFIINEYKDMIETSRIL